jgi:RimJ/RimL family protein N-acetyltransferase
MDERAIGYVRVSVVGSRGGESFLSPQLQRESIERVCHREGLDLIDVVEELDRSGGDSTRPLWNACIERIERGEAQALVCWNLSRFARSIVDAKRAIERIEGAGGRLYSEEGAGPSRRATVGYWLLPEVRGRGLATRAVRLISQWALINLEVARLGLLTEEANVRSQRVAELAGFHREGVLRSWTEINGRRVDYVSYSLLPADLRL